MELFHLLISNMISFFLRNGALFSFQFRIQEPLECYMSSALCFMSESDFPHVTGLCNIFA
jgi:hypothetical protein